MICKFCRCGKIIPKVEGLCEECKKELYSKNKATRKDFEKNKFYSSVNWIKARNSVRKRDSYICLYCYNVYHELTPVELVHHIVPFKEDEKMRLDKNNLISLCRQCHEFVHGEYNKSLKNKEKMQQELLSLISLARG